MSILNFFTDLLSKKALTNVVSEPFVLLLFGVALIAFTAGLRVFFSKREEKVVKLFREMSKAVVIRES